MQSILRHILFPAPYPPFPISDSDKDKVFWLPTNKNSSPVPCMLFSPETGSPVKYFFIWCHGNGGDMGSMSYTVKTISQELQAHALMFEYPTYGLLSNAEVSPSQESINDHAERAYLFVRDTLKWPTDRIILYGHSIGSGPACHLASREPVGALILQSPYTSIKQLIENKVGSLSNCMNIPFWNNEKIMETIACPVLFMHGERDHLVPAEQSQTLCKALKHNQKKVELSPDDDHNSISDSFISQKVKDFLNHYFKEPTEPLPDVKIDSQWREIPPNMRSSPSFRLLPFLINASVNLSRGGPRISGSRRPDDQQ
ncbi:unnamed protein product [Adineta ricciae]|uniref:Dienelactone hydrolase domain-containing protein n=1 Tax=Adineta ricciae TaxID=249248 RepID=A0A815I985_ADIRI|nr:unnamed protein product [Adineta ricciae]